MNKRINTYQHIDMFKQIFMMSLDESVSYIDIGYYDVNAYINCYHSSKAAVEIRAQLLKYIYLT